MERGGKIFAGVVRWIFADFVQPKVLWGDLLVTSVFLADHIQESSMKKAIFNHLRGINARAFVHAERNTKSSTPRHGTDNSMDTAGAARISALTDQSSSTLWEAEKEFLP